MTKDNYISINEFMKELEEKIDSLGITASWGNFIQVDHNSGAYTSEALKRLVNHLHLYAIRLLDYSRGISTMNGYLAVRSEDMDRAVMMVDNGLDKMLIDKLIAKKEIKEEPKD